MTTTDDVRAMLAAVLRDPADDVARLVFADALQEAGDHDRAAAIRYALWVNRANAGYPDDMPPVAHHDNGRAVLEGLGIMTHQGRGFVESITLTCAKFMEFAPLIFASQPVTRVRLTDKEPLSNAGALEDDGTPVVPFYVWLRADPGDRVERLIRWEVPSELWGDPLGKDVYSEEESFDAISRACVAYGRRLTGLPPLRL